MVTLQMENPHTDQLIFVGTFDWIQCTYNGLRGCNETEEEDIGIILDDGYWYLDKDYAEKHQLPLTHYTDIIISAENEKP